MNELKAAFAKLEASIQKQWGAIPTEIETDFNTITEILNRETPVEPPAAMEPVA